METKSYSISLFGLDPQYYTNATIGDIWNVATNKVYEETGISITGEVHERYFVSPEMGSLNGSTIFMVESKKVPNEVATDADYLNAYRAVIEEVRERLGYPNMSLTVEEIDIAYFEAI